MAHASRGHDAATRETGSITSEIDRITFGAGPKEGKEAPHPLAFRRLVVCVDATKESGAAVAWGRAVAVALKAQATVVHAIPPPPVTFYGGAYSWETSPELVDIMDARGHRVLDDAMADFGAGTVRPAGVLLSGHPVPQIVRLVKERAADLVVLGAHEHGALHRLMLGSVADGVKDHVTASVLIARGAPPPERVLVPVDGSAASRRAAAVAVRLVEAWKAHGTLLHVVGLPVYDMESRREVFSDLLGRPEDRRLHPRMDSTVAFGKAAEVIVEEAKRRSCDLIVMGSRGLGGLKSLVVGSVSNRVAHRAPMSVLLVKEAPA